MRPRPICLVLAISTMTMGAASCASDSGVDATRSEDTRAPGDTGPTSTADTTSGTTAPADTVPTSTPALSPADHPVAPDGPSAISGAADIRTVMAQLGFPADFPIPDGLATADVVGLELTQRSNGEYTSVTSTVAWSEPASDDPAALAQDWFDTGRAALGVAASISTGKIKGNDLEGFLVSGGLEDEPKGQLIVTVIRPAGDASAPVVVEMEHEIEIAGMVPDLSFGAGLSAALPDMTGCVAELVSANFHLYDAPNSFTEGPGYTTIFDGNCPASAIEAMRSWAATSGGTLNDNEQNLNVYGATGPDGMAIATSAYLGDTGTVAIRIDTTTPA